jgi:hypothetical protein
VTEAEWLGWGGDPGSLLDPVRDRVRERKLRLFACACCLRIWHVLADCADSSCEVAQAILKAVKPFAPGSLPMRTVEEITAAIAALPREQVAQIRAWLDERAEAEWDAQLEQDEREGRLNALAERALAEHKAGKTRPL